MSTWYKRSKLAWDTFQLSSKLGNNGFVQVRDTLKQKKYTCITGVTGLALAGLVYSTTNLETIPYSRRTHLVFKPSLMEKKVFGSFFYWVMKNLENWQELPATHPACMRLKPIAHRVIEAAKKALRDENYDSEYLDHFDWQVIVRDRPGFSAHCLSAGMIILDRGLVERLESEDEIAAFMAKLVANQLARHGIELSGKIGAFIALFRLLLPAGKMNNVVFLAAAGWMPFLALSRKLHSEETYIGTMVMATAGYDPAAAITSARRFPNLNSSVDLFSFWPSQRKKLEILGQAQDEAMVFYKEGKPFQASSP